MQIVERPYQIRWRGDDHFNDEQARDGLQRLSALAEDDLSFLIAPIMEYIFQQHTSAAGMRSKKSPG